LFDRTFLEPGLEPADVDRRVQSASLLHSNGDGIDARGRLFGWQANASPERLTRPLVRRDGELVETGWDTAMDEVVARSNQLLEERGPSALSFCCGANRARAAACCRRSVRRARSWPAAGRRQCCC